MRNRDIMTGSLFDFLKAGFHSQELVLEEFIMNDIIPALLPFCVKELVDLGFQVSIRNSRFVGGVAERKLEFLFGA